MRFEHANDRVVVTVDALQYPEDVVYKCFYWYTADFDVDIKRSGDGCSYSVHLTPKEGSLASSSVIPLRERIAQDLIDFKTRAIVANETKTIRELLIAKAFAATDTYDSQPPGDASDPGGFDPSK